MLLRKFCKGCSFFAHPENILVTMIHDTNKVMRELEWRRIIKARSKKKDCIRTFQLPKVNFAAKSYVELIDWQKSLVTEPLVTLRLTDDRRRDIMQEKSTFESADFPCHTQAVERAIKTVTEA